METQSFVDKIRRGDHACFVFDDKKTLLKTAVRFVAQGLRRQEQCIYIREFTSGDSLRIALAVEGIEPSREEAAGRLSIVTKAESYLRTGSFEPSEMIAFLMETTMTARKKYAGLRGAGEMSWALDIKDGLPKLLQYEAAANKAFESKLFSAICMYDRTLFPSEFVTGVVLTHPILIYNNRVLENPYYLPPPWNQAAAPRVELDELLQRIQRYNDTGEFKRLESAGSTRLTPDAAS